MRRLPRILASMMIVVGVARNVMFGRSLGHPGRVTDRLPDDGISNAAPAPATLRPSQGRNGTVTWHCHQGGDPNAGGGGIGKQMRIFVGAYITARLHNMYLYRGNLSFEYTNNLASGCNAPLEALLDLDTLPHLREMLVDTPVGPVLASRCEPCGPRYDWSAAWQGLYREARRGLRLAPRLRARVPRGLCPADACVCLHSRLEADFARVFRGQAGSGGAIAAALRAQYEAGGFWPATTLYVAGKDDPAYRNVSGRLAVVAKPARAGLRMFENALLDLEVCQGALYHVGTGRSLFDEWISEYRLLHNSTRSWDYYDVVQPDSKHTFLMPFHLNGAHGFK